MVRSLPVTAPVLLVTPAKAGVSGQESTAGYHEIPAFAGMTGKAGTTLRA